MAITPLETTRGSRYLTAASTNNVHKYEFLPDPAQQTDFAHNINNELLLRAWRAAWNILFPNSNFITRIDPGTGMTGNPTDFPSVLSFSNAFLITRVNPVDITRYPFELRYDGEKFTLAPGRLYYQNTEVVEESEVDLGPFDLSPDEVYVLYLKITEKRITADQDESLKIKVPGTLITYETYNYYVNEHEWVLLPGIGAPPSNTDDGVTRVQYYEFALYSNTLGNDKNYYADRALDTTFKGVDAGREEELLTIGNSGEAALAYDYNYDPNTDVGDKLYTDPAACAIVSAGIMNSAAFSPGTFRWFGSAGSKFKTHINTPFNRSITYKIIGTTMFISWDFLVQTIGSNSFGVVANRVELLLPKGAIATRSASSTGMGYWYNDLWSFGAGKWWDRKMKAFVDVTKDPRVINLKMFASAGEVPVGNSRDFGGATFGYGFIIRMVGTMVVEIDPLTLTNEPTIPVITTTKFPPTT